MIVECIAGLVIGIYIVVMVYWGRAFCRCLIDLYELTVMNDNKEIDGED